MGLMDSEASPTTIEELLRRLTAGVSFGVPIDVDDTGTEVGQKVSEMRGSWVELALTAATGTVTVTHNLNIPISTVTGAGSTANRLNVRWVKFGIREFKGTVRDYLEAEMNVGTAGNQTGRMLEGSARAFWEASDIATIKGTDRTGSNAISSADEGRLLRRSDTGEVKIVDNTGAWVQALGALSGTVKLINTPLFAGTAAGGDTFDPREFTIRGIYVDATSDTNCEPGDNLSLTAIASQVFGEAGEACFSTGAIDLSTRSTANSRALVIAQFNVEAGAGSCSNGTRTFGVYRDAMANQIGPNITIPDVSAGEFSETRILVSFITTLSNASHEFALHVENSVTGDTDCDFIADATSGNFLMVIDLGPDY